MAADRRFPCFLAILDVLERLSELHVIMEIADPTTAQQALEDLHLSFDDLIKLIDDRASASTRVVRWNR